MEIGGAWAEEQQCQRVTERGSRGRSEGCKKERAVERGGGM